MKFGLIISNTQRSKIYFDQLIKNNLKPDQIILLVNKIKIKKKLNLKKLKKFNFIKFKSDSVDNVKVSNYLLKSKLKNFIYSGYPGKIIKNKNLLKNKNLIHSHSGKLPEYPGSTSLYYMILNINKIFCSTIILNQNLDGGKILLTKKYNIPKNKILIENNLDNNIRAKNMVTVIKNFKKFYKKKKNIVKNFSPYYIAHPIIRQIVLNKRSVKKILLR
tara:strand:- start:13003 stop:13656 length:654 start_codon:yes stop_codon:yes gene_type:complete